MENLQVVIISALTASISSGLFLLVNSWMDRRHQRKVTVFEAACRMAFARHDLTLQLNKMGHPKVVQDPAMMVPTYYGWVSRLFDHGELPPEAKET